MVTDAANEQKYDPIITWFAPKRGPGKYHLLEVKVPLGGGRSRYISCCGYGDGDFVDDAIVTSPDGTENDGDALRRCKYCMNGMEVFRERSEFDGRADRRRQASDLQRQPLQKIKI